ncbi:MAG: DNA primase [Candidatus Pacebacteria bacterium]|nr:DNA primase [Candidatus Paceibacterota bacterium]
MISPVTTIKERLGIVEVVSSYIKVEKAGVNFKARCPFHNEKTPSFFISPERGSYYCFGCSAKGDIFTFVEEFEGLDFKGALKMLAFKAGVELKEFQEGDKSEKEKLYQVMEEATNYFINNLEKQEEIKKYLIDRGLNAKTISDFKVGFSLLEWRELYSYLEKKGFNKEIMEKAGLIKRSDKPGPRGEISFYDRFRGRIMFPIADSSGRIIAFSGRIFQDDGKSAKYLNSPDTPIFSKSSVLYGLDKAKESIRKNNFSILVEGQMDLLLSHQAGFRNTIASSGTALSDSTLSKENIVSNLGLVRRLSENIVLAYDGDRAGFKAAERGAKIALSLGMDVKVANLKEGMDPADLISKNGPDAWKEAVRESKHIIEFMLNKVTSGTDDTRKIGKEVKDRVLPYVEAIDSSIEKAHFLKKISEETNIPIEALKEDLQKVEKELRYEQKEIAQAIASPAKVFRKDYIHRRILGILFWQEGLEKPTIDIQKIEQQLKELPGIYLEERSDKEDLIFEAEVFYKDDLNLERELDELIKNLKEESLKEELSKKMSELKNIENSKDYTKSSSILEEISILNSKLEEIKNGRLKN